MKTLYIRIVATFAGIAIISAVLALFITNMFYQTKLKDFSEQKMMNIANEIRNLYEKMPDAPLDDFLHSASKLGFQIYAVDTKLHGTFYGEPFRHKEMDPSIYRRVLNGETYTGIQEEPHVLNVIGYFENSLRNSIGIPLQANGKTYALFVRPSLEQQIGEVRLLLAVLLLSTFVISLLLIVSWTRFIVKPIQSLTEATKQIVEGHYDVNLQVARGDEIGNLAEHFSRMARSLKQLDEMKSEFVANVSHEIQSPLTSMQGFAEAILSGQTTPEETRRYMTIIEEESRRLSSLSKQLLTLASLDKETELLKRTDFRLDEQIRQVVIVTEWQWSEKQLTIDLELSDTVIHADRGQLYQVWMNLLTNAIKFSDTGGTITIELAAADDIVVIIRDTGIGLDESDLPHIFERFYKADKARNRWRSGSGLGLAIVDQIVRLHGGTIEVSSKPGQGTAFTIHLPKM